MDKLFVLIGGVAFDIFVLWYFLGKREKAVDVGESVQILVDGGYTPEEIKVKKGKQTTLKFLRKDPSDCLEEIVIPEFKIRKKLPLNEEVKIKITPTRTGEFEFVCGMNMFHGKIIVRETK